MVPSASTAHIPALLETGRVAPASSGNWILRTTFSPVREQSVVDIDIRARMCDGRHSSFCRLRTAVVPFSRRPVSDLIHPFVQGGAEHMDGTIRKFPPFCAPIALTLGVVSTAGAQVFTGRVDVTIEDSTGGRLPGVSVDLSGPVTHNQVTDAQGEAHFLNLPVGLYVVKATLSGF